MKFNLNAGTLTLFFSGRVDSSNAERVEKEALDALDGTGASSVIVDADDLEYISSAGLRVLLKLAKNDRDMKVVNASRDVYDVFEMTGFTSIIQVERGLRKYSVEGCPIIGQGAVGTMYRYDTDTIVKVYRPSTSYEDLVREREYSQLAFIHGVPSRISYDIVKVGDCYGMVYEMIDSSSMGRMISKDPEIVETMAEKFAEVGKMIHAVDAADLGIASAKDAYLRAAQNLRPKYTESEYQTICGWIKAMPNGNCLLHGDFHPKNIMIQDGEPILIDMGDICYGHPLFDYGTASFVIRWLSPETAALRSGVPRSHADRFWNAFLRANFGALPEEQMAKINDIITVAGEVRATVAHGFSPSFPQDVMDARVADVRARLFPRAEQILQTLQGAQALFDEMNVPCH